MGFIKYLYDQLVMEFMLFNQAIISLLIHDYQIGHCLAQFSSLFFFLSHAHPSGGLKVKTTLQWSNVVL